MKRILDVILSSVGLLVASPVLIAFIVAVYIEDRHSPFYIAPRVGKNFRTFNMVKLRSMRVGGARGPSSTSADDVRITQVGKLVRKYKLDELTQLFNVLWGDMSLVGPRPNVPGEVGLYTDEERNLLDLRPGITDIASIVFADEGDILRGSNDADLEYNQLIRPWKSRLGLFYIENRSIGMDLKLIGLTAVSIISRDRALAGASEIVKQYGGSDELIEVARRKVPLRKFPPPGADAIVQSV